MLGTANESVCDYKREYRQSRTKSRSSHRLKRGGLCRLISEAGYRNVPVSFINASDFRPTKILFIQRVISSRQAPAARPPPPARADDRSTKPKRPKTTKARHTQIRPFHILPWLHAADVSARRAMTPLFLFDSNFQFQREAVKGFVM
ncbi:hypothetical protein EVAR_64266_1 [Eumeta japonica]|uniref:Uncharacterized protein n=1 Tax=Eumeta variegata TaxID=151549 RepID=A0A4C1YXR2_EUMVA|nr:hypothetical protein EVAR_64266_1 [Eumeta japonica]